MPSVCYTSGTLFSCSLPAVGSLPHNCGVMHNLPLLTDLELSFFFIALLSCAFDDDFSASKHIGMLCFCYPSRCYGYVDSTPLYLWDTHLESVLDEKLSWLLTCSLLHFYHTHSWMMPFNGPRCPYSLLFSSQRFLSSPLWGCIALCVESESEDYKSVHHPSRAGLAGIHLRQSSQSDWNCMSYETFCPIINSPLFMFSMDLNGDYTVHLTPLFLLIRSWNVYQTWGQK